MIKNKEPISIAKVKEYIKKIENSETDMKGFIKKFGKLNPKEATELKEKLKELDLMKIKPEHIVKIIDLIPKNSEELNKIFTDVSLDEDETKKILEVVKKFR